MQKEDYFFDNTTLSTKHASGAAMVRKAFKKLYMHSGVRYYKPHSLRDMIVQHSMNCNHTMAEAYAWSGNLGHKHPNTTFGSYGQRMSENERIKILENMRKE